MSEHEEQHGEEPGSVEGGADPALAIDGAITYLHIPATDVRQAAAFYGDVFGWKIHNRDSESRDFDSPDGCLSGAWVTDQRSGVEPGLMPYIYVDDVRETIARIEARGGEIVSGPDREGLLSIVTFRDPAGNVLGLWNDTTR